MTEGLTQEDIDAYKEFIFDCDLVDGEPHDGDPSVNAQVKRWYVQRYDEKAELVKKIECLVIVHIYTGYYHYELISNGTFKFETEHEVTLLEFTIKDVCEVMSEDGSIDAMITLHEF